MKLPHRIALVILLAAMLVSMCGCLQQGSNDAADNARIVIPTAQDDIADLYIHAAQAVQSAPNVTMQLELLTNTTLDSEVFSKHSKQTLMLRNQGAANMTASLEETMTIGTYSVMIGEVYADGLQYCTINDSLFVTPITAEEYLKRFVPGTAFDPALYGRITANETQDGITILFEAAAAAESWAISEQGVFQAASGQARLSTDGQLLECTYNVSYTSGTASMEHTATITYDTVSVPSFQVPTSDAGSVELADPRIPRLLEEVCGYLTQVKAVSAQTLHAITSEAFGIERTQQSQLHYYDRDGALLALRQSTVDLLDRSHGEEPVQTQQTECFLDGAYTIEINTLSPAESGQVTEAQMRSYCQELLVSTLLLPEYITAVTVSEDTNMYRLDFTASEALAQLIGSNACQTLYSDPKLLDDLASEYKTNEICAYLEIDKYTGLPMAAGIHYSGTHTIQQTAYVLSSRIDQVYTIADNTSYDFITEYSKATDSTDPTVTTEATTPEETT